MTDQPINQMSRLDELAVERNELAIERNELANERTILAYVRTSIMGFVTGVTLFKLFPHHTGMIVLGGISVGASVVIVSIGVVKFINRYKSLLRAHRRRPARSQ